MSKAFTFRGVNDGRTVSYFTTDRRRARRFARQTGIRFRVDRESRRSYAGGMTLAEMVAANEQDAGAAL